VIAVDTNILIYAHRAESPWHAAAARVIQEFLDGTTRWAIPWPCLHEFLGVVTHPRVFVPPTPLAVALEAVETWMRATTLTVLAEGPDYLPYLRTALESGRVTGPKVHDARIAALCLYHGVNELWSADRDLTRFPALRVRNPLVSVKR
jgi:hypothetical protein